MLPLALTYLAHSLLLAAAVSALSRLKSLSWAARNAGWRLALLAPFVSASISRWSSQAELSRAIELPAASTAVSTSLTGVWQLAALATAFALARYVARASWLKRRLRSRVACTDARGLARLRQLCDRAGRTATLTESSALTGPLVVGGSEICVPQGLLTLGNAELDAVLAHELAHLERHDGWWFPLIGALEALLWFYPVNRWICARFRDSAELACDDRALELTRDPLGLARALTHVAESATQSRQWALAPSMAHAGRALLARVRRLTNMQGAPPKPRSRPRGWLLVGSGLLAVALGSVRFQIASAKLVSDAVLDDLSEQSRRMLQLAEREAIVSSELASSPVAAEPGSSQAVHQSELAQELRHLRATQLWLEQRFVAQRATAH